MPQRKPLMRELIDTRVRRGELTMVSIQGAERVDHWVDPATLDTSAGETTPSVVHILSPFDPMIIQRKRLQLFFGYQHRLEAYLPQERRVFENFALPVLIGDRVVAAIDLKTGKPAR